MLYFSFMFIMFLCVFAIVEVMKGQTKIFLSLYVKKRFLDIYLERNPDFAPSKTLPTIDYLTSFLTKKSKGCKVFYKTLTKCTTFSEKLWS